MGTKSVQPIRPSLLEPAIKLLSQFGLSGDDSERLRNASRIVERYAAAAQVAGSDRQQRTLVLLSGWACEVRILLDGRRQIFSFLLPGDVMVVTRGTSLATRAIIALTTLEVVDISAVVMAERPASTMLLALEASARLPAERLFDHIVRLGRQSAYERLVHLILELRDRLTAVGLVQSETFRIPLTQEVLADALGLSIVHVNRTLQQLRREGLIEYKAGGATLCKPRALSTIAGYAPAGQSPCA